MPAQKSPKSASPQDKRVALTKPKVAAKATAKAGSKAATSKTALPPPKKVPSVPTTKTVAPKTAKEKNTAAVAVDPKKTAVAAVEIAAKKKPGRPPKAAAAAAAKPGVPVRIGAKRGPKPKGSLLEDDVDTDDIPDDEPDQVEEVSTSTEKVKPLRMKISKAKERALMKEFGLDEAVLSEEDLVKRRLQLKALLKLGKTRGYLTHGEISDHLPDKLVDAETMEVVISMLNDMGVAVYEQTPDAETLLLNNTTGSTTEEEAEEEAEAALSTVDSEFGRTTDPVRMYMREMGTVELLTREGEIEIAKRIEGGLMDMMEAISASPATIAEILRLGEEIREGKVVITTIVDGFTDPNEADDYVAEEDFDEFDEEDDDDGKGGS
ncbi:MAG TPA: RNA polymerase sigma factor region1.1 domain-containing protein, partial [Burkholderiaceae bacterium]|nr:RNA polymerase sigma factor region1.1 domain-containing protein [Burkholderiaceae bacterium]